MLKNKHSNKFYNNMKHLTPIFVTAVAVVIGTLLANVIAKQVPQLSSYEESYEEE